MLLILIYALNVIEFPQTITAHMKLYCEDRYVRDSILSIQFVGSVIGLIILSVLADKLGRKTIIRYTLLLTLAGSLFLTFGAAQKILFFLYVGQFLMGFGGYSLSMVSYSYLSEINNDIWRQKSLILTYAFWSVGEIMLFPIIRWVNSWSSICFFVFIFPLTLLLAMSYFICQTPEFLFVHRRYDQCLSSLNYISKFNGRQPIQQIERPKSQQRSSAERIGEAFFKRKFLIPLIVLSFAQVCNNGLYYATQYSISQFSKSFQTNMIIIGILELISCLITNQYCDRMERRKWIIAFMVASGLIGLVIQFTPSKSFFQIVFVAFSRLMNTFGFALFSLITTQSFPTEIRSTGTGISEAMSNLGNMAAPFLVTLGDEVGLKGVFISGIVCIIGGLSMFLVKQTKIVEKESNEKELGIQLIGIQKSKNKE